MDEPLPSQLSRTVPWSCIRPRRYVDLGRQKVDAVDAGVPAATVTVQRAPSERANVRRDGGTR
jgi:hypothetical protein